MGKMVEKAAADLGNVEGLSSEDIVRRVLTLVREPSPEAARAGAITFVKKHFNFLATPADAIEIWEQMIDAA